MTVNISIYAQIIGSWHLTLFQVWSFNRYLWNGFLCCFGASWLPCWPSPKVQVPCWNSAPCHKGGCYEVVSGEIWGSDP